MENVSNEVKKVSLKNERLDVTLEQEFRGKDNDGKEIETIDDVTRKCSQIVHADLKAAFNKLKPHLVVICAQPEAENVKATGIFDFDESQLENYLITGYSIGGSDDNSGVTIVAQKLLENGKVLNLVAPFTKYEDEDDYAYGGALAQVIEGCNYEVEEYLFKGKWGIKQQEFDFDTPQEADMKIDKEEAA